MSNKQAIEILDEIIKEYENEFWIWNKRIEGLQEAKYRIQSLPDTDEWISVLEKLPDDSYWDVLCYCKELNDLWISYYTEILHYNCWMWMKNFIEYNVTHWKPLPDVPKQ